MKSIKSFIAPFLKLWGHITLLRKYQLGLLSCLALITSVSEIFSIGMIVPFLGVIADPGKFYLLPMMQSLMLFLKINTISELALIVTIGFIFSVILACTLRLILLKVITTLSYSIGMDLSLKAYRNTLYQPLLVHISRNSSEVISALIDKINYTIASIISAVNLMVGIIMLVMISVVLAVLEPILMTSVFITFGLFYLPIIKLTKRRLQVNSRQIAEESSRVIKMLQEGLGGIRDILIDGTQEIFCKNYSKADFILRRAEGSNIFLGAFPRFIVEALGMIFIAIFAYGITNHFFPVFDEMAVVPTLGFLAISAQRLLPVMQQIFQSWTTIKGNQNALIHILSFLDQPLSSEMIEIDKNSIPFKDEIKFDNVSFGYGIPFIIKDINITIKKGTRVGFIGATGSGKSTLLDLLMGLLKPTAGKISVDGVEISGMNCRPWQNHIAHVPQSIYLADCSIMENIAFGLPLDKINLIKIKEVCDQARISDWIESLQAGYKTVIGERGVSISGGQRQRIGIARALYKNADVIIFDEATSALDVETERAVMESIELLSKDLTILIVAHRLSTLQKCSEIYRIDGDQTIVKTLIDEDFK
jgi:ABC-type multidrug transport system fused ATPase/permease subunit